MNGIWRLRERASQNSLWRRPARFIYQKVQSILGFHVSTGADFEGPPYFPHGLGGVYITHAHIGKDAVILQQVTIGANTLIDSPSFGVPTIGDRCYIGAGAKIIGAVVIGDDVRIGANAVVTRDVPSNSTVTGANKVKTFDQARDNRHWQHTPQGWKAVNGSGATLVSNDEVQRLMSDKR